MRKTGQFKVTIAALMILMMMVSMFGCAAVTADPMGSASTQENTAAESSTEVSEDAAPKGAEGAKVGFGLYFRNDQWWKDFESASVARAEELGIDLLVQDGSQDANKQAGQLEAFVAQGVDAIMYAPIDGNASSQAVADAKEKGIAVITMELTLDDPSNVTTQLVFDQEKAGYEVGKLAAQFMNDVHGGKGKYVCINDPANNVSVPKCAGFVKAMTEFCPTAERVPDVDGKTQRDPSVVATENLLVAHDDLYVFFAGQTDMALGAMAVLDAKGLDASQYFVGGEGWGDEFYEALTVKKYVKAICVTPGVPLGLMALQLIADNLNEGKPYPEKVLVPADIVTAENAKEYFKK